MLASSFCHHPHTSCDPNRMLDAVCSLYRIYQLAVFLNTYQDRYSLSKEQEPK